MKIHLHLQSRASWVRCKSHLETEGLKRLAISSVYFTSENPFPGGFCSLCVFFFSLNIEVYVTLWISFKSSCCCLLGTEGSPKSKTDRARLGNLRAISTADTRNEEGENMDDDDKVAEYWNSDHHKFEWSNYMQSLDSRSWHALGLGVPESFLSRGQYFYYLRICSIAPNLWSPEGGS